MALADEEIRSIMDHLGEWLAERSLGKAPAVCEIKLRERMVRVEKELKHQRELIKTILVQMNKRLEALQEERTRRFEAVDKRFEELTRRRDRFMCLSFGLTMSVGALMAHHRGVEALALSPDHRRHPGVGGSGEARSDIRRKAWLTSST